MCETSDEDDDDEDDDDDDDDEEDEEEEEDEDDPVYTEYESEENLVDKAAAASAAVTTPSPKTKRQTLTSLTQPKTMREVKNSGRRRRKKSLILHVDSACSMSLPTQLTTATNTLTTPNEAAAISRYKVGQEAEEEEKEEEEENNENNKNNNNNQSSANSSTYAKTDQKSKFLFRLANKVAKKRGGKNRLIRSMQNLFFYSDHAKSNSNSAEKLDTAGGVTSAASVTSLAPRNPTSEEQQNANATGTDANTPVSSQCPSEKIKYIFVSR